MEKENENQNQDLQLNERQEMLQNLLNKHTKTLDKQ